MLEIKMNRVAGVIGNSFMMQVTRFEFGARKIKLIYGWCTIHRNDKMFGSFFLTVGEEIVDVSLDDQERRLPKPKHPGEKSSRSQTIQKLTFTT